MQLNFTQIYTNFTGSIALPPQFLRSGYGPAIYLLIMSAAFSYSNVDQHVLASFPVSTPQLFPPLILLRAKKSWGVETGNEATTV